MILTGSEILKEVKKGNIMITPFDDDQINPNSYNYKL
jgi:dCTP deaminase